MITDPELERYLDAVAKGNGGMGRATAARFIIAEHRKLSGFLDKPAPAQPARNRKRQPAHTAR